MAFALLSARMAIRSALVLPVAYGLFSSKTGCISPGRGGLNAPSAVKKRSGPFGASGSASRSASSVVSEAPAEAASDDDATKVESAVFKWRPTCSPKTVERRLLCAATVSAAFPAPSPLAGVLPSLGARAPLPVLVSH